MDKEKMLAKIFEMYEACEDEGVLDDLQTVKGVLNMLKTVIKEG